MMIYWVGPLLGSLLAAGFYKLVKALEYEAANPGQDFDENETKIFDAERDIDRPIVSLMVPANRRLRQLVNLGLSAETRLVATDEKRSHLSSTNRNLEARLQSPP
ncbi:hypothetical protein OEA41_003829 [Lepraria neglecta]|uniref:Uncharacterized protein n=1 Tax=Lepraria neglecta TaxID=209136 RepID=A0AAE0DJL7_9LECA|nr:hypothetical protein OEA41_003829 [Lepraria neglecta]